VASKEAITEAPVVHSKVVANRVDITEVRVARNKEADNRVAITEVRVARNVQEAASKVVTVLISRETGDQTGDLPYTIQGLTRKKLTQKKYRKK
jgi:predicted aspartyl protease